MIEMNRPGDVKDELTCNKVCIQYVSRAPEQQCQGCSQVCEAHIHEKERSGLWFAVCGESQVY